MLSQICIATRALFKLCRLLVFVSLSMGASAAIAQSGNAYNTNIHTVQRMIEKYHIAPRAADEQFRQDVMNDFINALDADRIYLTAEDVTEIKGMRKDFDAELAGTGHAFLDKVLRLYKGKLQKTDSLIGMILQKPFDFSTNDVYQFAGEKSSFKEKEAIVPYLTQHLKHQVLRKLTNFALQDSTISKATAFNQESTLRNKVLKVEQRKIKRILQHPWGCEAYVSSQLSNALAEAYDPHTAFFPVNEKENFDGQVSTASYAFGVRLNDNDKGDLEIAYLQPGSPAWRSGDLNKGDMLVKMQWEGKAVVDLSGADMDEVSALISESNHDRLILTVKKANGLEKAVTLQKEKLRNDGEIVRSFILNGTKKVGYIVLPGFYSEWEDSTGSSCANDVAKEIVKLKKENIDALILDLRNNGGGSLQEAMELSGIFIEEGVLGFGKVKAKTMSLKDPNRGTIYDGPLVVMVNGFSASASEMVAGALQDYNRALIVGSSTYGKATMQVVLPADTNYNDRLAMMPSYAKAKHDFVKVTMGKLYRATGGTNQLKGVQPDINLPDISEAIPDREATAKHALGMDTVKRALYFKPLPPLPIKELADKSLQRQSTQKDLVFLKNFIPIYKKMVDTDNDPISLKYETYLAMKKNMLAELNKYEGINRDTVGVYQVANHLSDQQEMMVDTYLADINKHNMKTIKSDLLIRETYNILTDYLNLKK